MRSSVGGVDDDFMLLFEIVLYETQSFVEVLAVLACVRLQFIFYTEITKIFPVTADKTFIYFTIPSVHIIDN